jgi:hypothetical protein
MAIPTTHVILYRKNKNKAKEATKRRRKGVSEYPDQPYLLLT